MEYDIIIGLEIHAELKTKSKMFCSCDNMAEGRAPNTVVCPICLGHPGTLPVANKRAIEDTILLGLALHCRINSFSKFDRKNYFYPDLPKGYQISQYDLPFCHDGYLEIDGKKILITRIHLEEDTGKLSHPAGRNYSLVDFNRAGTPLVELVTKPVISDAATAKKFCQAYRDILRYLDISYADMEKGHLRCEANVSLQKRGGWKYDDNYEIIPAKGNELNAKVELKNINSFRAVEKAIIYEIKRQAEAYAQGEKIAQETRGWNEAKGETVLQRVKETSADYRYFPEPDLPPIEISPVWLNEIRSRLMELPAEKKERFKRQYKFGDYEADILVADKDLADFTERVMSELRAWIDSTGDDWERQQVKLAKAAANWLLAELFKHFRAHKENIRDLKISPENFAEFITLVYQGKVNSSAAQEILAVMYEKGGDPTNIMKDLRLEQIDDEAALLAAIKDVLEKNKKQAAEYQAGKQNVIQFLVGQVMAATKGKANPKTVQKILKELLEK